MWSLSLVMSECSLSGRGQSHVSNFYIVDLENFACSKSSAYRWYPQLVRCRFVYDTYSTMEAIRSRHGWIHMFITQCPTVTSNFITLICPGLVVQVVSALLRGNWQDFNWHDASRGPSLIAELHCAMSCDCTVWYYSKVVPFHVWSQWPHSGRMCKSKPLRNSVANLDEWTTSYR